MVFLNIWVNVDQRGDDLLLLTGYQLAMSWEADLRLLFVVKDEEDEIQSTRVLKLIAERARLPAETTTVTHIGEFEEALKNQVAGDLNLIPLSVPIQWKQIKIYSELVEGSCLFVLKSGKESARA